MVLIVIAFITRFVVAFLPPFKILYSIDERIMSDSTLLIFTNSTPTCLEWPATTLMIPLFFISFIDMLMHTSFFASIGHFDMIKISDSLTTHLYHNFTQDNIIVWGRILIAITGIISYFFVNRFLQNEKKEFRLFFIFLYTISAATIIQSWVLHPDSIAVVFWILFILYYLFRFNFEEDTSLVFLSAFFVLLAASKFTYVIFLPLLILSFPAFYLQTNGITHTLKHTIKFLIISGVLLFALFPFIWTDSLTFAKSFIGNIVVKSSGSGNSIHLLFVDYLPSLITYPGMILSLIGFVLSFKKLGRRKATFLFLTFLLFAYPIANASQSYERYSLSLFPMLLIWASYGFCYCFEKLKYSTIGKVGLSFIILLCLIQSGSEILKTFNSYHQQNNFSDCKNWIQQNLNANDHIALPISFDGVLYENKNCLSRIIGRNNNSDLIVSKLRGQLPPEYKAASINLQSVVLEDIFMDEKKYLDQKFKVKFDFVSSHPIPGKAFDIYYYTTEDYSSLHCFRYNEVFSDSSVKFLVTEKKPELNLQLIKKFDQAGNIPYYLYKK